MTPDMLIRQFVEKWPSPLVARTEVERFSGGIVTARTLANHDSAGTGPQEKMYVRGRIAYPVESLARWLVEHLGQQGRDTSPARRGRKPKKREHKEAPHV